MAVGPGPGRVIWPTVLVGVIGTLSAITVNLATGDQASPWTWVAVAVLTVLSCLASLWLYQRSQNPPTTPGPLIQIGDTAGDVRITIGGTVHAMPPPVLIVALVLGLSVVAAGPWMAYGLSRPGPSREAGPAPPVPLATSGPSPTNDIRMHEVWASSAENITHFLDGKGEWAMTTFPVTVSYLRSLEMAAGPNGRKVLLSVKDDHDQELAQGEAVITDYRAKVVFEKAVDLTAHVGGRLHLELRTLTDDRTYVYLSKNDRNAGVASYLSASCRDRDDLGVTCPNPLAQDLSVLVVGRKEPW